MIETLDWLEFGLRIFLAIMGLAIYSLWKVRSHLRQFSWNKFTKGNGPFWFWAFSLQFCFALVLLILPDGAEAIKTMVGLDYSEPMAFLSTGVSLGAAANAAVPKKPPIDDLNEK